MVYKKNVLVFGVGSLGSYLAAKLSKAGHNVDVVGREKAEAIGSKLYINGEEIKFPKVMDDFDLNKYYNYIIITSKYYDLKRNLESIVNSGVRFDTIVLIQNTYIDNIWYYHLVKDKPIVILSVYEGYNLEKNKLTVSEFAGWFVEEDILGRDMYSLLKNAGININFVEDSRVKRAEKTIYNCASNIFSAIHEKTLKELIEDKQLIPEVKGVFDESYDVLAEIIPLRSKTVLWNNFVHILKHMNHYTSTYQDVKHNNKTELAFLNGFIIDLGRKMDISVPHNMQIVKTFKEKYPNLY